MLLWKTRPAPAADESATRVARCPPPPTSPRRGLTARDRLRIVYVQPDVRKDELRCLDRADGTCALPGSKRDMTPGSRGAELVGDAWRAQQLAAYGPAAKP